MKSGCTQSIGTIVNLNAIIGIVEVPTYCWRSLLFPSQQVWSDRPSIVNVTVGARLGWLDVGQDHQGLGRGQPVPHRARRQGPHQRLGPRGQRRLRPCGRVDTKWGVDHSRRRSPSLQDCRFLAGVVARSVKTVLQCGSVCEGCSNCMETKPCTFDFNFVGESSGCRVADA